MSTVTLSSLTLADSGSAPLTSIRSDDVHHEQDPEVWWELVGLYLESQAQRPSTNVACLPPPCVSKVCTSLLPPDRAQKAVYLLAHEGAVMASRINGGARLPW
jgi:hypothetical protein